MRSAGRVQPFTTPEAGSSGPRPGGEPRPLRVVIADDAPLIRGGVALVLSSARMEVVAQAGDVVELLAAVDDLRPDVVVSDVRMPPTQTVEGLQAAAAIRRDHPDIAVLLLSNHHETTHLAALLEAPSAGVGYLLKERVVATDEFVEAVHRVADGYTVLDAEVVDLLMRRKPARLAVSALTEREREVLAVMATGASNAALSRRLHLSPKTTEAHIASIFRKLAIGRGDDEHRRVKAVLAYLQVL
jgi:DNA-binding NarL/FixJ family response regulator